MLVFELELVSTPQVRNRFSSGSEDSHSGDVACEEREERPSGSAAVKKDVQQPSLNPLT